MKVTKVMVRYLIWRYMKDDYSFLLTPQGNDRIDVPYKHHPRAQERFDLFFAPGQRKKRLLIDIHGGAYLGGIRKGNHLFASYFLERGYDVLLADYPKEEKGFTLEDQISSLTWMFSYIKENLKELYLEDEKDIFLTGDSAGGHYALLLAEWMQMEKISFLPLSGILLNCPVYDFAKMVQMGNMTENANAYLYGEKWNDEERNQNISPRHYIKENHLPLFVSSSDYDFLRQHYLWLDEDSKAFTFPYEGKYIHTDNKDCGHVHNVIHLEMKESQEVNEAMLGFMEKYSR